MNSSKANQLQILQHNLQNIALQKQQFDSQLSEVNSALEELDSSSQAYKIVGKIMIASSTIDLKKDLQEKKEVLNLRLNTLTKQEEKLRQSFAEKQQEVIQELKKEK